MSRARLVFPLALLALATLVSSGAPVLAHHDEKPIQPGAPYYPDLSVSAASCTLNFLFRDPAGTLYVGTAGHCHRDMPLGTRASVPGVGEFGSLAYVEEYSLPLRQMDFGLIRIDDDKHHLVDPAMRVWGGPTAVQTVFTPGTPTLLYGHPVIIGMTEATRAWRPGVLEYVKEDPNWVPNPGWYVATNPTYASNSGGPIITGDGKALGVVAILAPDAKGLTGGPTIQTALAWMAELGWELELVTAPYSAPDALQAATVGMVEHCQSNTVGDASNPTACVVPSTEVVI